MTIGESKESVDEEDDFGKGLSLAPSGSAWSKAVVHGLNYTACQNLRHHQSLPRLREVGEYLSNVNGT